MSFFVIIGWTNGCAIQQRSCLLKTRKVGIHPLSYQLLYVDQHIHCLSEATASSSEESEESSDEETPHSEDASAPTTTPNGIILSFVNAAQQNMLFLWLTQLHQRTLPLNWLKVKYGEKKKSVVFLALPQNKVLTLKSYGVKHEWKSQELTADGLCALLKVQQLRLDGLVNRALLQRLAIAADIQLKATIDSPLTRRSTFARAARGDRYEQCRCAPSI